MGEIQATLHKKEWMMSGEESFTIIVNELAASQQARFVLQKMQNSGPKDESL